MIDLAIAMKKQTKTPNQTNPFFNLPTTKLGWWAVALAFIFGLTNIINTAIFMRLPADEPWRQGVLPVYGIIMLACGLAAGMTGLAAIIRRGERSWIVWLTLLPGVFVVFLLVGEFLFPH